MTLFIMNDYGHLSKRDAKHYEPQILADRISLSCMTRPLQARTTLTLPALMETTRTGVCGGM